MTTNATKATLSEDATNNDSLSPYYGTKFADPNKRLIIKDAVSCTGLEPNTEHVLYTSYVLYKNGSVVDRLGGYHGTNFTTDAQGAASFDVSFIVTEDTNKDYDTVRSICSVHKGNTHVLSYDTANGSELTTQNALNP